MKFSKIKKIDSTTPAGAHIELITASGPLLMRSLRIFNDTDQYPEVRVHLDQGGVVCTQARFDMSGWRQADLMEGILGLAKDECGPYVALNTGDKIKVTSMGLIPVNQSLNFAADFEVQT